MTGSTGRYGLTTLNDGDDLSALDYRFGTQDRVLLDRLLQYAVEGHVHTGSPAPTVSTLTPTLDVQAVGGVFPAGKTIHYRFGLVDARGQEYVATSTYTVVTPQAIPTPSPPLSLTPNAASGSLPAGDYLYALSAYTDTTGSETLASRNLSGTLPQGGAWTLALPSPPSGATGWNVYRRAPGDLEMNFVATAPIGDTYVDNGSVRPGGLRPLPSVNTTRATSAVQVRFPGGLPTGSSVRIYRAVDQTDWTRSLVGWAATDTFLDTGHATQVGMPLAQSTGVGGPPKIRWNENTEGSLPPSVFTTAKMVSFNIGGPVAIGLSPWQWICEYDVIDLWLLRATLGRGSVPAADPVIATVWVRRQGETDWRRIWTPEGAEVSATINPGESTGAVNLHDSTLSNTRLHAGDALRSVIHQSGGGTPPTDRDLSITATIFVHHGSGTTYVWKED